MDMRSKDLFIGNRYAETLRILPYYLLKKIYIPIGYNLYYHLCPIMLTPNIAQIIFHMNCKVFCHLIIYAFISGFFRQQFFKQVFCYDSFDRHFVFIINSSAV